MSRGTCPARFILPSLAEKDLGRSFARPLCGLGSGFDLFYSFWHLFDRYEHLGDTVLGLSVTSLMMEMYPGLRVGPSTVSVLTGKFILR